LYDHKDFFLSPKHPFQKQYEALRAFYIDGKTSEQVAIQFGFSKNYFDKFRSYFHQTLQQGKLPNFFAPLTPGRNTKSVEEDSKQRVIALRKMNHSIVDIKAILDAMNINLNHNQIDKILKADGFARLHRRSKIEKTQIQIPTKIKPPKCQPLTQLDLIQAQKFDTRYGGVFLFLPLIPSLSLLGPKNKISYYKTIRQKIYMTKITSMKNTK